MSHKYRTFTVKELRDRLALFPEDAPVYVNTATQWHLQFQSINRGKDEESVDIVVGRNG